MSTAATPEISIRKCVPGDEVALAAWAVAGLFLAGCSSMQSTHASTSSSQKGGAQLWAENCTRCHNIRSLSIYSDAEWDVAMHHMRIRANLTAEQSKRILTFLKSAN